MAHVAQAQKIWGVGGGELERVRSGRGFGRTDFTTGNSSPIPHQVKLRKLSSEQCEEN